MSKVVTPSPARLSRETAGLGIGLIGVIIFGGTLPATRVALGIFSPWFVTFGRAALASIAAALLLMILRRPFPRAHVGSLLLAGLMLVFGFPAFSSIAMQTVPAAHGGVVLAILPLLTSIFATLLAGERPSVFFWLCGITGTVLVVAFAVRDSGMTVSPGDAFLFLAALTASLGYVVSGKISRVMPGWEVISWALVLTAPVSLLGTAFSVEPHYLQADHHQVLAFLYLGLGSMFLGFFAWNIGLGMGGIARVSQVQLFQCFVTLAISSLVLGEHVGLDTVAFAVAVMVTVALGRRARVSR